MSQISPPTPYTNAAPWRLWRRAVANPPGGEVDPVVDFPLRITRTDRIVTAGSCFAQNIARHVRLRGFTYLVTEPGHAVLDDETLTAFQYGIYSARYGNIYSARQLLQLFRRAHGEFMPQEPVWRQDGAWFDPFRPLIQPDGFASLAECEADRAQHLAAVRRAFADLDVFIFTLGLTEIWESAADGAVFPLCPGAPRGVFDPARYRLRNLTVAENVADLTAFLGLLRAVNPGARVILTVSPVPLVATAEAAHVLTATTLSKSVLRVAADTVCRTGAAAYFPAYEIVTGVQARGAYFADDCRSVTEAGVAHVMRVFFRHAAEEGEAVAAPKAVRPVFEAGGAYVQVVCEEESLDEG